MWIIIKFCTKKHRKIIKNDCNVRPTYWVWFKFNTSSANNEICQQTFGNCYNISIKWIRKLLWSQHRITYYYGYLTSDCLMCCTKLSLNNVCHNQIVMREALCQPSGAPYESATGSLYTQRQISRELHYRFNIHARVNYTFFSGSILVFMWQLENLGWSLLVRSKWTSMSK